MDNNDWIENWTTQLRKGLAEMIVLAAISRLEQAYGYQLREYLAEQPGLKLTEGTVYPLLAKLVSHGNLTVTTKSSNTGPPRRYYKLTAKGTRLLNLMQSQWSKVTNSLNEILP